MEVVRAKARVTKVTSHEGGGFEMTAIPVYDDGIEENARFAKATPSGEIRLWVDNPPAREFFTLGRILYVDFVGAESVK
jgi:hypothetical protein